MCLKMEVCPCVQAHTQTQQQAAACKGHEVALFACDTGLGSCLCACWACTALLCHDSKQSRSFQLYNVALPVQVSTAVCYAPWAGSHVPVIIAFVLSIGSGSSLEYVQVY